MDYDQPTVSGPRQQTMQPILCQQFGKQFNPDQIAACRHVLGHGRITLENELAPVQPGSLSARNTRPTLTDHFEDPSTGTDTETVAVAEVEAA